MPHDCVLDVITRAAIYLEHNPTEVWRYLCRTFTIGQAAGDRGTQRIQNFTRHLAQVVDFPDSDVPIPYVDLLYVAVPQYRSGSSGKKVRTDSDTCGPISGATEFREEFAASALKSGAADKAVEDSANDEVDMTGSQVPYFALAVH